MLNTRKFYLSISKSILIYRLFYSFSANADRISLAGYGAFMLIQMQCILYHSLCNATSQLKEASTGPINRETVPHLSTLRLRGFFLKVHAICESSTKFTSH